MKIGIKINISITEADIENIITSSLEGGSNRWLRVDITTPEWKDKPEEISISTWATNILLNDGIIRLHDINDKEDEDNAWTITLQTILNGIEQNITKGVRDKSKWDCVDADHIMQYALLGSIIYN